MFSKGLLIEFVENWLNKMYNEILNEIELSNKQELVNEINRNPSNFDLTYAVWSLVKDDIDIYLEDLDKVDYPDPKTSNEESSNHLEEEYAEDGDTIYESQDKNEENTNEGNNKDYDESNSESKNKINDKVSSETNNKRNIWLKNEVDIEIIDEEKNGDKNEESIETNDNDSNQDTSHEESKKREGVVYEADKDMLKKDLR